MASTSVAATAESPNWVEMPKELMASILQRAGPIDILSNARKVCTTWRRICKDPAMWKVIDIHNVIDYCKIHDEIYDPQILTTEALEKLTEEAVDLSCGELIDFSIEGFGTDHLLDHLVLRPGKLKRICLTNCRDITGSGLSRAVKRLPQLEELHLYYITINAEDIEFIGENCPQLRSFIMNKEYRRPHKEYDGDANALAIANNMPELRHLQVFGNKMTNEGLKAILESCLHLKSLDVRRCFKLDLGGYLGKLCKEQIEDFKGPNESTEDCEFQNQVHLYHIEDDLYYQVSSSEEEEEEEADY